MERNKEAVKHERKNRVLEVEIENDDWRGVDYVKIAYAPNGYQFQVIRIIKEQVPELIEKLSSLVPTEDTE